MHIPPKTKVLFFILILFGISSCTTGEQEKKSDAEVARHPDSLSTKENARETAPSKSERIIFQFICRDIASEIDNPLYEVSFRVGNTYYNIDTIHTCEQISISQFDEYEIPEKALAACGGWHLAEGEYYYAIQQDQKIKVMYAWQTEEQSVQGYFYKLKREIDLPAIENIMP